MAEVETEKSRDDTLVNAEPRKATKRKKWQRVLLIMLFVALNVGVIVATAANEFGNSANAAELSEVKLNWWLLLPAAGCFLVAVLIDIYKYVLMIRKMSGKSALTRKEQWKVARRTVVLGRYYDNITPAAVGGQPFQIYYMRKNGRMGNGVATAVPVLGMISLQIGFIMIALVCFTVGGAFDRNPALIVTGWIGLLVYAFWPVMVMMATFFPKATTGIIKFLVKVLAKVHIVKDREKALVKAEREVAEYVQSIKLVLKKPGLFLKLILLSLAFNALMAMIPFFVLATFGGAMDFWQCFVLTIAVMAAVYFVPTPGNSGAAEGTFYMVFSGLSTGYVFWAMLFWRLFSYYSYIIMGLITYFSMQVEKRRAHDHKKQT